MTATRLLLVLAVLVLCAFAPTGPGASRGGRCAAERAVLSRARQTRVMIGNIPNRNYQIAQANLAACLRPNGVGK